MFLKNLIPQILAFLIVLLVVPFKNDILFFSFCSVILISIFSTSFFVRKHEDRTMAIKNPERKARYGSLLINIFCIGLYSGITRILAIITNGQIGDYILYLAMFFSLIKILSFVLLVLLL
jgi:hypothetical protein